MYVYFYRLFKVTRKLGGLLSKMTSQIGLLNGKSKFAFLANGRKLFVMAWCRLSCCLSSLTSTIFFQPLLRNYQMNFFQVWGGASIGRGLPTFLIACWSDSSPQIASRRWRCVGTVASVGSFLPPSVQRWVNSGKSLLFIPKWLPSNNRGYI